VKNTGNRATTPRGDGLEAPAAFEDQQKDDEGADIHKPNLEAAGS
jgi:hypothetical protein